MSQQRGGMRGDELGVMVPFGGGNSAKEMIRPPKEVTERSPAAGILNRGNIRPDLYGLYALAATLAGTHKPTLSFLDNFTNAGLGVLGRARREFLMADAKMLVPQWASAERAGVYMGGNGHDRPPGKDKNRKHEDEE
jgi:hypothetical protein